MCLFCFYKIYNDCGYMGLEDVRGDGGIEWVDEALLLLCGSLYLWYM